jgi:hypothetical protein
LSVDKKKKQTKKNLPRAQTMQSLFGLMVVVKGRCSNEGSYELARATS